MAKASDNPFPSVLLVEQAAAPTTPSAGQARLYRGTDNKNYIIDDTGTSTEVGAGSGFTYAAFTPALTAVTTSPTLGTGGSATGRYAQSGKHVEADAVIQFGTSGAAAGSGSYRVSLPVATSTALAYQILGYAQLYDSSAGAVKWGFLTRVDANTAQITEIGTGAVVSSSAPWAWAINDVILVHYAYEAA